MIYQGTVDFIKIQHLSQISKAQQNGQWGVYVGIIRLFLKF